MNSNTNSNTGTGTGTNMNANLGMNTNTNMNSNTNSNSNSNSNTGTGTGTGTNMNANLGMNTNTNMNSNMNANSGTNTNTNMNSNTNTSTNINMNEVLNKSEITEIILHPDGQLNYELNGKLVTAEPSVWKSIDSIKKEEFISKIIEVLPQAPNYENPLCSGVWNGFRVQVIAPPIIDEGVLIQLRRLSKTRDFRDFKHKDWQGRAELTNLLEKKIKFEKSNFIIAGPTGCGKTTLLKSLLSSFCKEDRILCLEDTPELPKINTTSTNLKTYNATSEELSDVTLDDLVKTSLRLRPDRLMMGEMRGEEASSFLLMLSTGHKGSGATLHAHNPQDALRRLEMLVQMGNPWNLQTVRQLIYSSLDIIITMGRDSKGRRSILKVSEIENLEDHGFLVHHLYENSDESGGENGDENNENNDNNDDNSETLFGDSFGNSSGGSSGGSFGGSSFSRRKSSIAFL